MILFDLASFVFQQISTPAHDVIVQKKTKNVVPLYHIRATCRSDDVLYVESLIRQSLASIASVPDFFDCIPDNEHEIVVFDVEVRCVQNARKHLVQMVSRLGLEGCVRSVRWNVIAEKRV